MANQNFFLSGNLGFSSIHFNICGICLLIRLALNLPSKGVNNNLKSNGLPVILINLKPNGRLTFDINNEIKAAKNMS